MDLSKKFNKKYKTKNEIQLEFNEKSNENEMKNVIKLNITNNNNNKNNLFLWCRCSIFCHLFQNQYADPNILHQIRKKINFE